MKSLLLTVKRRVDITRGSLMPTEAAAYWSRYDEIFDLGDKENPIDVEAVAKGNTRGRVALTKARNLLDRMKLYKKDILRFMDDPEIPFDNNHAERDIHV